MRCLCARICACMCRSMYMQHIHIFSMCRGVLAGCIGRCAFQCQGFLCNAIRWFLRQIGLLLRLMFQQRRHWQEPSQGGREERGGRKRLFSSSSDRPVPDFFMGHRAIQVQGVVFFVPVHVGKLDHRWRWHCLVGGLTSCYRFSLFGQFLCSVVL